MAGKRRPKKLDEARAELLRVWADLGPAWGVNRTMSQIHALMMVTRDPMNTDEIMADLDISRGNAHKNVKELLAWGLLKRVPIKGELKVYFVAEKDVWKVVQIITRERKRKELQPVLDVLDDCLARTSGLRDAESRAFRAQVSDLKEFADMADGVMERVEHRSSGVILRWVMKLLK